MAEVQRPDRAAIFKRALKDYGDNRTLKRFVKGEFLSPKEEEEVTILLSEAAQSICCDAPYFVPYVSVQKDRVLVSHREMKKLPTPFGSAWFPDHLYWHIVILNGKAFHFTMSSHCIDRIKGRIPMDRPLETLGIFLSLFPNIPIKVNGAYVCPISTELPREPGEEHVIGYCPLETYKNMAIAKSFLLPGMIGTPEHEKLAAAGRAITFPEKFSSFEEYLKAGKQVQDALKESHRRWRWEKQPEKEEIPA